MHFGSFDVGGAVDVVVVVVIVVVVHVEIQNEAKIVARLKKSKAKFPPSVVHIIKYAKRLFVAATKATNIDLQFSKSFYSLNSVIR